jgi:hypothetical protein
MIGSSVDERSHRKRRTDRRKPRAPSIAALLDGELLFKSPTGVQKSDCRCCRSRTRREDRIGLLLAVVLDDRGGDRMSDWENVERTVAQALARLQTVLDSRGPLSVASALEATASAVTELRRLPPSVVVERVHVSELIDLMQRVAVVLYALSQSSSHASAAP